MFDLAEERRRRALAELVRNLALAVLIGVGLYLFIKRSRSPAAAPAAAPAAPGT